MYTGFCRVECNFSTKVYIRQQVFVKNKTSHDKVTCYPRSFIGFPLAPIETTSLINIDQIDPAFFGRWTVFDIPIENIDIFIP